VELMKKTGKPMTKAIPMSSPKKRKTTDLYDFCSVLKNSSFRKILTSGKHHDKCSRVFSDYITRINSNCERKMRVCAITNKKMYILYPETSKGILKLKYLADLELITKITVCKRNSTLIKISIMN
jgi:hypothetical protein